VSFCNITCRCGFEDSFDAFVAGLPPKQFRCPKCGLHTEIQDAPPTVYPSGFVMPGPRRIAILKEGKVGK
jgi:hypothetical protein